jgi:hypothetical protein
MSAFALAYTSQQFTAIVLPKMIVKFCNRGRGLADDRSTFANRKFGTLTPTVRQRPAEGNLNTAAEPRPRWRPSDGAGGEEQPAGERWRPPVAGQSPAVFVEHSRENDAATPRRSFKISDAGESDTSSRREDQIDTLPEGGLDKVE